MKDDPDPSAGSSGLLLALCAAALASAVELRHGLYHPPAFIWLGIAILLAVLAATLRPRRVSAAVAAAAGLALLAWFVVQFHLQDADPRSWTSHQIHPVSDWRPFFAGLYVAFALAAAAVLHPRLGARVALPCLLLLHLALGVWILRSAPNPRIDVYDFQALSCRALLDGVNPYAITFPNNADNPQMIYGPGVFEGDRLLFGYPYFPLSLLLVLPAHVLLGDFRYAHELAILAAAAMSLSSVSVVTNSLRLARFRRD